MKEVEQLRNLMEAIDERLPTFQSKIKTILTDCGGKWHPGYSKFKKNFEATTGKVWIELRGITPPKKPITFRRVVNKLITDLGGKVNNVVINDDLRPDVKKYPYIIYIDYWTAPTQNLANK